MIDSNSVQAPTSLAGQAVVGTVITTPWLPGAWEVTQGWGQTDYSREPEGHGYQHWHAGVDIGCDSGTVLAMPAGLTGTAKAVDNPSGYGTALVVQLDQPRLDVWFGHLRQRLVSDGEQLRPGMLLAVTNSTGNSTGPHLHFEVRPRDGRYGTDLDPSALLLQGTSATPAELLAARGDQNPYGPLDPRSIAWDLQHGIQSVQATLVGGGQVALGAGMLLSGLLVTGYGVRGRTAGQLRRDVGRAVTVRRREARRRSRPAPVTGAEATRVRPNLQQRAAARPYSYTRPR